MKKFILLYLSVSFCIFLKAQQPATIESVTACLKQMRSSYNSSRNLSFDVSYTYSKENAPGEILDSLFGRMQISNGQFHWSISNTEMVTNSKYEIILFSDDKLMYITKPAQQDVNPDPFARLDSTLLLINGLQCTIDTQKDTAVISLNFPDSSSYKQIKLVVNSKTGFIANAQFIVKQEGLNRFSDFDGDHYQEDNSYSIIKAIYSNYSTEMIDSAVFNETNYFKKTGTNFNTVSPYTDFKIFIGSPNL